MSYHVYSTATCNNIFNVYDYENKRKDINVIKRQILIKGGSNNATRRTMKNGEIWTPHGVRTEICDEDMEYLMTDFQFKRMLEKGFMKIEKKKMAPEKAIKDMQQQDESAPITPKDYIKTENGTYTFKRNRHELASNNF